MIENLEIVPFKKSTCLIYIDEIVRVDRICMGEKVSWTKDNFLLDLLYKNRLSKIAIVNKKIVGYIICSSYFGKGHIHRLVVDPAHRRLGIGMRLVDGFSKECLKMGILKISAETQNWNIPANKFYKNIGFLPLMGKELEKYLSEKGKKTEIMLYNSNDLHGYTVYKIGIKEILGVNR